ncbi:hypothetical protein BKA65DRAFT_535116 [Rhexocercosporidium sp. MPI-PUGE-AT-0058]|nr:hypothetical protein BKA65DRAFT_535116 [Rhexocercosporidium sp. MPI-PUGE-AT-0058]
MADQQFAFRRGPILHDIDHFDGPVILLFGLKGTRKAAFASKVTGTQGMHVEEVKETCEFIDPVRPSGERVAFVFIPAFDNGDKTEHETMADITSWISKHLGKRLKVTAAIYFHSIAKGTDDGKTTRDVRLFNQIVGTCSTEIVRIASMDWCQVEPAVGEKREAEQSRHGWKKVWMPNVKTYRLRNDDNSCIDMLQEVLKIEPRFIKAQTALPGDCFAPLLGKIRIVTQPSRVDYWRKFLGSGYVFFFVLLQIAITYLHSVSRAARTPGAGTLFSDSDGGSGIPDSFFRAVTVVNFIYFMAFEAYAASKRMKWL